MKKLFIADVGDGLCMSINTISDEIIQIDCGSQQGSKVALKGLERSLLYFHDPDVFILSHFHGDHYNGILYASSSSEKYFRIKEVYFPRIPDFKDKQMRKAVMDAIFTMNMMIFGSETGVMEYDFLKAISKINEVPFKYKPLAKGDIININGSVFEILWPPRVMYNEETLSAIKQALRDFEKALEEDKIFRELYDRVREEGVFKSYLEEGGVINPMDGPNNDKTENDKINGKRKRKLPEVVKKANKSIRGVANHLSLALLEDNRILFLGDLENFEIRQIVDDLKTRGRTNFYTFITPHHGTHWDNSLYEIRCIYAIASNGKKLCSKMKPHFKEISERSFATHVNGDLIGPPMLPLRKLLWYIPWWFFYDD